MDSRTLLLHLDGGAELVGPRGDTLWASDSDEEFQQHMGGEYVLTEDDLGEVIEFLIAEQYLTGDQAKKLRVYVELEEGGDGAEAT